MSNPAQYITGYTIEEQMDELINYVDTRSAEVGSKAAEEYLAGLVEVEELDVSDFPGYTGGTLTKYTIGPNLIVYSLANLELTSTAVGKVDTLDEAVSSTFRVPLGSSSAIAGQMYIDSGTTEVYLRVSTANTQVNGSLMVVIV